MSFLLLSSAKTTLTTTFPSDAICPGFVETPLFASIAETMPGARQGLIDRTPLDRLASPGEIGNVIAFLLSESAACALSSQPALCHLSADRARSADVSGATVCADGGFTITGYVSITARRHPALD